MKIEINEVEPTSFSFVGPGEKEFYKRYSGFTISDILNTVISDPKYIVKHGQGTTGPCVGICKKEYFVNKK